MEIVIDVMENLARNIQSSLDYVPESLILIINNNFSYMYDVTSDGYIGNASKNSKDMFTSRIKRITR